LNPNNHCFHADTPILTNSTYKLTITRNSPIYLENGQLPEYHYHTAHMHVSQDGSYIFFIDSTVDAFINIYKKYFDPNDLSVNSIRRSYVDNTNYQLKFTTNLQVNQTYTLLASTISPEIASSISIFSIGPSFIIFNQTSKYITHNE